MRYRLDDLGWYCFEQIIQSLLKVEVGLTVEAWSGCGDQGRDAYSNGPLRFPNRDCESVGPFVFQMKFVSNANATGAHSIDAIVEAVRKEKSRISYRRRMGTWREAAHYVLLTNAPLSTDARTRLLRMLQPVIPETTITLYGGEDVCGLLDHHPRLRRSFPEILGLRDLNALLGEVVNKSVLERSRVALEETRDLVPVFVPTKTYHEARRVLERHSFVVLDGPPEMGKTAIARSIALTHLLDGWESVDCGSPHDVFALYDSGARQIFVADDAFGRTEYNPVLGREWERDLSKVFRLLDGNHRLIWTTRKHILQRALKEMDLVGAAAGFPSPGEVSVSADVLVEEEKARILYRHCRAARLSAASVGIVKRHARAIVRDEHFTPERIRRFAVDVLPNLGTRDSNGEDVGGAIKAEIRLALQNPTDRMRKSFRGLTEQHKWVLLSLLECRDPVSTWELKRRFEARQGTTSEVAFNEVVDELNGTFVKRSREDGREAIRWIHPSYRDLVVEELAINAGVRQTFLGNASATGIQLALSEQGGPSGNREMPLMSSPENWEAIASRCTEIAASDSGVETGYVLDALARAHRGARDEVERDRLGEVIAMTCESARRRWEAQVDYLDTAVLRSYERAADCVTPRPAPAPIEPTWEACVAEMEGGVGGYAIEERISSWCDTYELVRQYYPTLANMPDFKEAAARIRAELFRHVSDAIKYHRPYSWEGVEPDKDTHVELSGLVEAFWELELDPGETELLEELSTVADMYDPEHYVDTDREDYEPGRPSESFSIDELFRDL